MIHSTDWRSRLGVALMLLGLGGWRSPLATAVCPDDLATEIETILQRQSTARRAHWGILISPLAGGYPLYARNAQQFFIPASNIKLFTTAAALTQLGADYRIRTSVYQEAVESGEVVLRVVGRGDPTLTEASLQTLARQVRDRGIHHIDRLIVDDTYFTGDPINPNWEWEDLQAGYGTAANSLMLEGNAIALQLIPQAPGQPLRLVFETPSDARSWTVINDSRTLPAGSSEPEFTQIQQDGQRRMLRVMGQLQAGSEPEEEAIASPDPNGRFLRRFWAVLEAEGVTVRRGAIATTPQPNPDPEVAFILSPPLAELMTEANAESDNFYAEALLRQVGVHSSRVETSTLAAGLAGVETILAPLGVDAEGLDQADGSGLARRNLATPEAFVQTLQAMHGSPSASVFRDSLAVAGMSGTLRNRFRDTPVAGNLWGKSGAISGIAALSGYLEPEQYPPLAFSILVNHFDQPVRTVRPTMDEIIEVVADLTVCEANRGQD